MTSLTKLFSAARKGDGRLGHVLALFALLLAPLALLADKAVVPLVLAAAVLGGFAAGRAALPWRSLDRTLVIAFGVFMGWCLVTSAWSPHPPSAVGLAVRVGVLLLALLYLVALAQRLQERERLVVRRAFCAGFAVATALVIIELAFGTPILNALDGAANTGPADYWRLNRGVSALAILIWPLAALFWQRGQRWLACLLPPVLLAIALASTSSASILALGAGIAAAAISALGRPLARTVMASAVLVTLFGSPFIVPLAEQAGLARADSLALSAQHRLHIWGVVTDHIAARPLLGWGFDASPDLPTEGIEPFRPGVKIIPSHPHNGALQIMVETGLVGSLLALVVLILLCRRIDALTAVQRTAATAMLVAVLSIGATAYGLWQSHWLAVIGAAAAVFIAVLPAAERGLAATKPAPAYRARSGSARSG